ncbi:SigE family RNA polymerase sigma factor [Actinoplanes bogorensis]|uniref:SigE family RNA polymerase sigma factor n=1 Tax=Paractinoplanes bogorensis TaxID=1610840 RepID=A0ABS5Z2G4_9ACTN|nr:SigE family RNA polymerase sigma factor [Actinoplanes bogorensis]MBU2669892.1 SigE family RNA polymerase sigma factor [Actinoplanes bogorensis]
MRWAAPEQFAEFVRVRHAALLRYAYLLCGDTHLAQDLVQDALERTGVAWRRIEAQGDPEGYLRRTITNRYLNRVRSLRRERLVGDTPEVGVAGAEPSDGSLFRLLACLPRQQRAVIVMRYYLDLSEAQIAEALGCSAGTVKSTASRAIARLRRELGSDIHPQPAGEGVR